MIQTDLHIHSCYSNDGEYTVPELINRCKEKQIHTLSITDHNSVRANKEATEITRREGINYIPGIEVDCIYKGINLHVLGYHIDWKASAFHELEEEVSANVLKSLDKMIENIQALGFRIAKDTVLEYANGILPSAEMIAEIMLSDKKYHTTQLEPYMQGGARSDMPYINFYLDYFAQGKPAFVPVEYISFDNAIQLIKDNGGIPVIAHPGLNLKGRENIAEELLAGGALGLEVFNNYHSMEQISYFAGLVQQTNKLMTCGSDFHGKTKPLIEIGKYKFNEDYETYLQKSIMTLLTNERFS